jgi:hypothetical protein
VYSIDRNPCQTALLELKIAAIKELDYETFWKMFGDGRLENFRKDVYPRLRKLLTPESQKFWDSNAYYFVRPSISFAPALVELVFPFVLAYD